MANLLPSMIVVPNFDGNVNPFSSSLEELISEHLKSAVTCASVFSSSRTNVGFNGGRVWVLITKGKATAALWLHLRWL